MKVITEERLMNLIETDGDGSKVYCTVSQADLQELDTLTVSKLRPMCDADSYSNGAVLVALKGDDFLHEAYFNRLGLVFVCERYVTFDECEGWLPIPVYKPELPEND